MGSKENIGVCTLPLECKFFWICLTILLVMPLAYSQKYEPILTHGFNQLLIRWYIKTLGKCLYCIQRNTLFNQMLNYFSRRWRPVSGQRLHSDINPGILFKLPISPCYFKRIKRTLWMEKERVNNKTVLMEMEMKRHLY